MEIYPEVYKYLFIRPVHEYYIKQDILAPFIVVAIGVFYYILKRM